MREKGCTEQLRRCSDPKTADGARTVEKGSTLRSLISCKENKREEKNLPAAAERCYYLHMKPNTCITL